MYPRKVILQDESLKKLILEKSDMVKSGIETSEWIEKQDQKLEAIEKQIIEAENKVNIEPELEEAKAISLELKEILKKAEAVKMKIFHKKKDGVPKELFEKYEKEAEVKEQIETERNKIALKVQKWKDKIIPIGQRLMEQHLENQYEDYDTLLVNANGDIEGTIFSHLETWKQNFKRSNRVLRSK